MKFQVVSLPFWQWNPASPTRSNVAECYANATSDIALARPSVTNLAVIIVGFGIHLVRICRPILLTNGSKYIYIFLFIFTVAAIAKSGPCACMGRLSLVFLFIIIPMTDL